MSETKKLTGYPSIDKPWLKYYSEEARNAQIPECTIWEYMYRNNKDYPNDTALLYFGRKISYGELFKNIDKCAAALLNLGVKENDIVTVALPSIPEALYLVYALNKIGAVANMIHPLAGAREIRDYLNEVSGKYFFMFTGTYDIVAPILEETQVEKAIVISPGESLPFGIRLLYNMKNKAPDLSATRCCIYWKEFIKLGKNSSVVAVNKDIASVALISHTGGTTGEPKGVMVSDRNVNAIIMQIGCTLSHHRQETTLVVLPPFINYSLVNAMFEPLALGFKTALIPDYKPECFHKYFKQYHPNHINSIPHYLEAILGNEKLKNMDMSCIINIVSGGDGLNEEKEKAINEFLHDRGVITNVRKGLGSTELVSCATFSYKECNEIGSVGIPLLLNNCKIIDPDTGNELKYNEIGEICFSSPTLMIGYYNKQEATDSIIKLHDDGQRWIHTGDLGFITEDGVIFVKGRIKRMICTKGNDGISTKIFPDRIERVVSEHPAVSICCSVGVPDEIRNNIPMVYVVINEGYSESEELTESILTQCKNQLPNYMVPEIVKYMEELPRTNRGKVDYRALEKMAEEHKV